MEQKYDNLKTKHQEYLITLKGWDDNAEYWSRRGEKFDVQYESLDPDVQRQLKSTGTLGCGSSGCIHRIVYNQIPLARKSLRAMNKAQLTALQSEVAAVKRVESHHHIVKLVGTYGSTHHEEDMLHILTFPVAHCDLDKFLSDLDNLCGKAHTELQDGDATLRWFSSMEDMLKATGLWLPRGEMDYPVSTDIKHHLDNFVGQSFGCISSAILWIHSARIAHDDLKPANILLLSGHIYITDFGISRDRSSTKSTSTEFFPGSTPGWTAPEKGNRHNPFQTDIYSLGCMFMHMISVQHRAKTRGSCTQVLQTPHHERQDRIEEHLLAIHSYLQALPLSPPAPLAIKLPCGGRLQLIKDMLSNDGKLRPIIEEVDNRLLSMSGNQHAPNHGECCKPYRNTLVLGLPTDRPGPPSAFHASRANRNRVWHKHLNSPPFLKGLIQSLYPPTPFSSTGT